jgi:hypothetical protein
MMQKVGLSSQGQSTNSITPGAIGATTRSSSPFPGSQAIKVVLDLESAIVVGSSECAFSLVKPSTRRLESELERLESVEHDHPDRPEANPPSARASTHALHNARLEMVLAALAPRGGVQA